MYIERIIYYIWETSGAYRTYQLYFYGVIYSRVKFKNKPQCWSLL